MSTTQQPAVDIDKLHEFVFRAVDEVGATLNAALVVIGDKLGLYRALAGAGAADAGRAGRAHRHRRALRARVAERPGGRRLRGLRRRQRTLLAAARAGRGAGRRRQPRLPAGLLPDRAGLGARLAADHRGRPHRRRASAGTSTSTTSTRAASASSGPATTPTWSPSGCRPSRAWSRSSSAGATVADVGCGHGASTILMAQAFPQLDLRRLRLPRGLDRDRPRSGPRRPGWPIASASRSRRPRRTPAAATTW